MAGWERIERDWLFAFLDAVPRPWPKHAVLAWLRYAYAARERGAQIQTPTKAGGWVLQGALLSGRDFAEAVGLTYKVTRSIIESDAWTDPIAEPASEETPKRAHDGRKQGAARAQAGRSEGAKRETESATNADRGTSNGRKQGAARAQAGRSEGADRALARAFPLTPTPTLTPTQTREADRDLTDSPPPAEPSGSLSEGPIRSDLSPSSEHEPSQLPTAAGKKAGPTVADLPAWVTEQVPAIEEFQPVSDGYRFEDAHHDGIPEQPSNPRQIESPAVERNAANPQFGPGIHPQTLPPSAPQRNAQPSDAHPHRAPEAPPQGSRPSPTRSQGTGEGATGPVQGALWGSEASGAPLPPPPPPEPAKAPPRPRKEPPAPVDLTHPDDPCLLLLGKDTKLDSLTEPIVAVYREWWRRQPSPATCKLTPERVNLITSALKDYTEAQLRHVIRFAYEAADLGRYQRAWRGESGQEPPGLEMLTRKANIARNVEESSRWSVERIEGAPPADPLPSNVHPFPMPPPPRPAARNFQAERFAILQEMIMENQRNAQQ